MNFPPNMIWDVGVRLSSLVGLPTKLSMPPASRFSVHAHQRLVVADVWVFVYGEIVRIVKAVAQVRVTKNLVRVCLPKRMSKFLHEETTRGTVRNGAPNETSTATDCLNLP